MKCKLIFLQTCLLCLLNIAASAQQNICLDSTNDAEEVSLAISPKNPANIVAGANITLVYRSADTGRNWKIGFMKSPYGVWGDPIIQSDTGGNFYFFHLSTPADGHWIDRMVCQKSTDEGETWNDGTFVGLNGEKNQDKPGVTIDLTKSPYQNRIYLAWTQFDHYNSANPLDSSRILFSYSEDGSATWSKPIRLDDHAGDCLDKDNTVEGAVPAVGPKGQVYVSWGGPQGLVFNKSYDGGKTWLAHEKKLDPLVGGWDYLVPGTDRCDGMPVTCCDISKGPHSGTIYINWSDQRNGTDNTDVWIIKSSDEGETWSKPIRVNNDSSHRHQFMSWLSVDPATGYLYCIFYDRRNHKGDTTDVYLAVSKDGGESFANFRINDRSFVPTSVDFFGDYISVQARNNIVRPIWMEMNHHRLRVCTALINAGDLDWVTYSPPFKAVATQHEAEKSNYTNSSLWLNYDLKDNSYTDLGITDMWGHNVCTLYYRKPQSAGHHEYILDLSKHPLPAGTYAYKLYTPDGIIYKPIVIY